MKTATLKAYAKINIGLDITGLREDGYHLLKTCMQTINLYDEVAVSRAPKGQSEEIRITSDSPEVPADKSNIAWKAADIIKKKYGIEDNILIDIKKNIPMAAGLAGGSADGAAVIKAMDQLFGLNMSRNEMDETALLLGADVAFCLRKGLWLCEGIGEILSPLPPLEGVCAVIVKPKADISTKWCYQEFDRLKTCTHPDMDALICGIKSKNKNMVFSSLGNILESVSCRKYPEIEKIKQLMLKKGAQCSGMSGSGSTTFGLFENIEKAAETLEFFKKEEYVQSCYLTEFVY